MITNSSNYCPIDCEAHDLLEALATTRTPVHMRFRDGDGLVQERSTVITDVFSRGGAEYLSMSTGETLRLDQILSIDGAAFPEDRIRL